MRTVLAQVEHEPVGAFSGPMLAALEAGNGEPFTCLTITPAGVGAFRFATRALGISGLGYFRGGIISIGEVSQDVSERTQGLSTLSTDVEIADDAGLSLHKVVASFQARLRGATVFLQDGVLTNPYPPAAVKSGDWYTRFAGVLDSWEMTEPNVWRFGFRTNDQALRGDFPKRRITAIDWPNAFHLETGQLEPIVMGIHSALGLSGKGMIACLRVDGVGFVYLVSRGIVSVPRVYADGTLKTVTTDYTITFPVVNGYRYTCIDFVSDPGSAAITCDVTGLTDKGDGTGTVITGPIEIALHVLSQFIYGDWKDGAWLSPDTAPVDLDSAWSTSQWFLRRGFEASLYIGDKLTTGVSLLDGLCESFEFRAYWTEDGKIAFAPLDHGIDRLYFDRPWSRGPLTDDQGIAFPQNAQQINDKVSISYVPSNADGGFKRSLDMEDYRVAAQSKLNRETSWSAARIQ